MAESSTATEETRSVRKSDEETDEEEEEAAWGDWREDSGEGDEPNEEDPLCLFCPSRFASCDALFAHCAATHRFDFSRIRKALDLDFYGCFKLINYVRSQVAENRCWSCQLTMESNQDLQHHLHETVLSEEIKVLWDNIKYLNPFMQEDSLLHSFYEDEDSEQECAVIIKEDEVLRDSRNFEGFCAENGVTVDTADEDGKEGNSSICHLNGASLAEKASDVEVSSRENVSVDGKLKHDMSKLHFSNNVKNVNENYFGAYSSFDIHKEMISDKVRMDAYSQAILKNPSVLNGAVVMDIGCGTGILSLFAAKAGASRVIAIEASEKMAAIATQVAKDNKLWHSRKLDGSNEQYTGVIEVVQAMVEELDESKSIQPHSIDVLLSEWMGYCLLYESMLSSVIFARDRWLKPGGAILPDTATIFVAGFGKDATSLKFWENVYDFNMSCIGKELVKDAARVPIVDVVDGSDVVTNAAVLQTFDLVTMKPIEVDFTASIDLEPKSHDQASTSVDLISGTRWCYGVVLWFETGFTSRFCKEAPTVLSTSPFTPRTHWAQTILTFREPIAITSGETSSSSSGAIGTEACPAVKIHLRISIARAVQYRSIDISLEVDAVGADGQKNKWPVQIFTLN